MVEEQTSDMRLSNYTKLGLEHSSIKAVSTVPIVPKEIHQEVFESQTSSAPTSECVVSYRIQERLQSLREGEEAAKCCQNVQKIRKEIQRAYRGFAEIARRTEKEFRLEIVLRPLLTGSSQTEWQQTIIRRTLRSKLELIWDVNLKTWSLKATGGLPDVIHRELMDIATSTKAKKLYSVEVLLKPWRVKPAVSQKYPTNHVPHQQQEPHDRGAQRSPYGLQAEKLLTDATTQTLPYQIETLEQAAIQGKSTSPISEAPVSIVPEPSSQSSRSVPVQDKSRNHQPSLPGPVSISELQVGAVSHGTNLLNMGYCELEGATKVTSEQKKQALEVPVEETVSRLMARKKERQASSGPDAFLSLLDLVKKR